MAKNMYTFGEIPNGVAFIVVDKLYLKYSKDQAVTVSTYSDGPIRTKFQEEDPVQQVRKLSARGSSGGRVESR